MIEFLPRPNFLTEEHVKLTKPHAILILDFGSQYTYLISKCLRELGFFTKTVPAHQSLLPADITVCGIILSGGPDSVSEQDALSLPGWVTEFNIPTLGICYGMQLIANHFGGRFESGKNREFGASQIYWQQKHLPYITISDSWSKQFWMSHSDHLSHIPKGFEVSATSENNVIAAIHHTQKQIIGLQFHPEVEHSKSGKELLYSFAHQMCKLTPSEYFESLTEQIIQSIKTNIGNQGKVLMAVSGGVDSTVSAVLLTKAIGKQRVSCVMIDHGMMRIGEIEQVKQYFSELGVALEVLDRRSVFFERLHHISNPEQKRKIIGQCFIDCFEEWANASNKDSSYSHLGQGTLYSDVIESAGDGCGSQTIKSHHNVGGLPEKLQLSLIEPLRQLFKDEVRKLGKQLGISSELLNRHPFPGPGLGIRLIGKITPEKIEILQRADEIFIRRLRDANLYHKVWQAGAILLPVKSVGVMGDQRTYEWTCVLRAVNATDAMTASVTQFPEHFLPDTAVQIVNAVPGINRVLYDLTSKPPATIEWE